MIYVHREDRLMRENKSRQRLRTMVFFEQRNSIDD